MVWLRLLVCAVALTGCSSNLCWSPTSSALAGGSGTLAVSGTTSPATSFTWSDGAPNEAYSSFTLGFGDARIDCVTLSKLSAFRTATSLGALVSDRATGSACQITVGSETMDWTGGTLAVTPNGQDAYTVRLDAQPTIVGDVTVELDGLTGTATFEAQGCPNSGSGFGSL